MLTIAVFNQKGEVDKTTTGLNLAARLALARRHPLAIDFYPQRNLFLTCGLPHVRDQQCVLAYFGQNAPRLQLMHRLAS